MITGTAAVSSRLRSVRQISSPSMPGSIRSSSTRSGVRRLAAAIAAAPVVAVATS